MFEIYSRNKLFTEREMQNDIRVKVANKIFSCTEMWHFRQS